MKKPIKPITKTEAYILDLFVKGLDNKQIARIMGISINTVHVHFNNIHHKAEIHKAVPLAFWWARSNKGGIIL
jgi:two-component system nitrate/nitrite response regulator NarL